MPWSPQQDCDQKQMRPGPAIRAASFVDLSSCHPAARDGEPTVLVRQRSRMSATFTSTGCRAAILRITSPPPLRWPAANPLQEREVEEAAMPGQPVRTRARFRMSLAIHPQELPAATSVTAIVVRQALWKFRLGHLSVYVRSADEWHGGSVSRPYNDVPGQAG